MSLLVLSGSDVSTLIAEFVPDELQILMARVFMLLSAPKHSEESRSYAPQRISLPTSHHTALIMPARIVDPSLPGTAIKIVCVPQSADTRGIPGSTLVMNEDTGAVKAIVNSRGLTALRNAAGSLLSTNLVGVQEPRHIVTFGAGKQIEAHIDLHLRYFPSVELCTIVNRSINPRSTALKALLESRFPKVKFTLLFNEAIRSSGDSSISNAMLSADIIICATSSKIPLFPSTWVRNGTHVILIGSYTPEMHEVDRELVLRAIDSDSGPKDQRILLVDSWEACATEAGELIHAGIKQEQVKEIGEIVPKDANQDIDLKKLVIAGKAFAEARGSRDGFDGPITIFKSVGIGLQDVAIACAVVKKAEEIRGPGTWVSDYDASV